MTSKVIDDSAIAAMPTFFLPFREREQPDGPGPSVGSLRSSPEAAHVTGSYQICQYDRVMILLMARFQNIYAADHAAPLDVQTEHPSIDRKATDIE
jgi:hypothetical protein